jgi:O-antigen/teichoic acid export membrane protein
MQYLLLLAAARSLSVGEFGDVTFALGLGYMLAQVADFGLQLFVQRELARQVLPEASAPPFFKDEASAARLVGGGLVIKAGLSAAAMVLMGTVVLLEPVGHKGAVLLLGLSMVLMTGLEYLSYCFRALRKLKYEALALMLARGSNLLLGVALLYLGAGVWGLALAGNAAMLLALVFGYRLLAGYVKPIWWVDVAYWRRHIWQPTAMGLGIVFSIISFRVDNLLMLPVVGREGLGLYNAAYKLFEPTLLIPSVLLAATFPMLANLAQSGGAGRFRQVAGQTVTILLIAGTGVTVVLALVAVPAITLLYGREYAQAAGLLQILAFACLPLFVNYGLTHILVAMDRPHLYAIFTLAALAVNIAGNLTLLPVMGARGAALATVATEVVLLALCAGALWRYLLAGKRIAKPAEAIETAHTTTTGGAA